MTLRHYYEKELSALYEEANTFAKQFPEHASALNMEKNKSQDPHVARLLEGCAFLTAKIHHMIDKEADHLPEQLIQRLWPQLSEGFPSVCMIQATPMKGMQSTVLLPKSTSVQSPPVGEENTTCKFHTVDDLSIFAMTLSDVVHIRDDSETIVFVFDALDKATLDFKEHDSISLYIDAKITKAQTILHLIFSKHSRISIEIDDQIIDSKSIYFDMPALDTEHCLNPHQSTGLYAQQLLFEAFCFPEKLQWIKVKGLSGLNLPIGAKRLVVEVSVDKPIDHAYQFSASDFRLFCVPAINLYSEDAEPILLDHKRHRYPISIDHHRPVSTKIHSILSVKGTIELNKPEVNYSALHEISDLTQPYYVFQSQGYLSFGSDNLISQTVSVEARVSNAHYPRRFVRASTMGLTDKRLQSQISVSNFQQPSAYLPKESKHQLNLLLQLLRVKIEQISTAEHLRLMLNLMNRSNNDALTQKINAVHNIKIMKRALIKKGIFHHVHVIQLDMNELEFVSASDRFVFGRLLHAFFQASASITTIIETRLCFFPSECLLTWLGHDE